MEKINFEKRKNNKELVSALKQILEGNENKRVVVVGTTCTGKTTFLREIIQARDMDELVFPQLTQEERDYVCQTPWTPEIGRVMEELVKEKVKIVPGEPVFGTVVIDSDLIIYLHISDQLLEERTQLRKVDLEDAKNMQKQIEQEIEKSKIPYVNFFVG